MEIIMQHKFELKNYILNNFLKIILQDDYFRYLKHRKIYRKLNWNLFQRQIAFDAKTNWVRFLTWIIRALLHQLKLKNSWNFNSIRFCSLLSKKIFRKLQKIRSTSPFLKFWYPSRALDTLISIGCTGNIGIFVNSQAALSSLTHYSGYLSYPGTNCPSYPIAHLLLSFWCLITVATTLIAGRTS